MLRKIKIFDTTLRDGEQSPGASMTLEEKKQIAKVLEKMNVDVIEAGFPAASNGDFESVSEISKIIKNSTVCALSRANEKDIKLCGEALKKAKKSRIHTFIATSDIHMKYKLKMSRKEVVEKAVRAVKLAKVFTDDVEFSAEDALRSDRNFLCEIFSKVIEVGATTLNVPDTVGYTTPNEIFKLIKYLKENIKNINNIEISVHCHNDLGMATANSLSAIEAGANQVECTINGIGERAGNAALEEVVMALKTRKDFYNADSGIDISKIVSVSNLVSNITSIHVQPNKAIVGVNAFSHEAGIHQDGILKKRETYEIMKAQDVGWEDNTLVLGKHSGRNALKNRIKKIGLDIEDKDFEKIFIEFKKLADKKHDIVDGDILSLISRKISCIDGNIKFINIESVNDYLKNIFKVKITLKINENEVSAESNGNGIIDALFSAINKATKMNPILESYNVNSIGTGTDAQAEVNIKIKNDNVIISGSSYDTSVIIASAKAYVNVLNKINNNKKL